MTAFVPGDLITHTTWREARSALPDAPVVPDEPATRVRHRARARLSRTLRALARQQVGLAERLDPSPAGHGGRARPGG
jgi:hypothetical protein